MTKLKENYTINDIILAFKDYSDNDDEDITKSYEYAKKYMNDDEIQNRLNVSHILTTVNADSETIAACMLYQL
jgi:(p)ppGpp synthase/HD superfamily hydrolase